MNTASRSILRGQSIDHVVARMSSSLRHRGPDGDGLHIEADVGLGFGHRRLAIIDLGPSGAQPMRSADQRFIITYNGELYNAAQLRGELVKEGVRFRGSCDTEVLLESCAHWGVKAALQRLNGMFAFALWDHVERTLHLARDHAGIKPLYWAEVDGAIVFASEVKAFHQFPGFAGAIDHAALSDFFRYLYVPEPRSIYRDVRKVRPGELISISQARGPIEHRWWDPISVWQAMAAEPVVDGTTAVQHLDELMHRVLEDQSIADVEVGTFLSGGIDSSTVSAMVQATSASRVRSFCIGYDEPRFDESPHAEAIARALGTDHTSLKFRQEDCHSLVTSLPKVYDEPFADFSQLPTLVISKLARGQVKAILSGDGGDELFSGYDRHRRLPRRWAELPRTRVPLADHLLGQLCSWLSVTAKMIGRPGAAQGARYLYQGLTARSFSAFFQSQLIEGRWVSPPLRPELCHRVTSWPPMSDGPSDHRTQARLLDLCNYLPGDILTKVDRASMWHGLEVRVPLLDRRVMEFVPRLSENLLVRGDETKYPLRQLLARSVDRQLFDRPKMGFHVPLREWLRSGLREWAEDLLSVTRLESSGLLDVARVRHTWDDFLRSETIRPSKIWTVLMFQAWWEEYHG